MTAHDTAAAGISLQQNGDAPTRHPLAPEDAMRMSRLSEEVRARLLEMSLILTRTVGGTYDPTVVPRFVPHTRTTDGPTSTFEAKTKSEDWMEITTENGEEVCYGVISGVAFAQSPC